MKVDRIMATSPIFMIENGGGRLRHTQPSEGALSFFIFYNTPICK